MKKLNGRIIITGLSWMGLSFFVMDKPVTMGFILFISGWGLLAVRGGRGGSG